MQLSTRKKLEVLEGALLSAHTKPLFGADWASDIPETPGVYMLWDVHSRNAVYVGQTGSLRHRMRDLRRTVNHTCRKKLAEKWKLESGNDALLSKDMARRCVVSLLVVEFGRTELEEYLMLRWRDTLVNSYGRRLNRGNQYKWVKRDRPTLPVSSVPL